MGDRGKPAPQKLGSGHLLPRSRVGSKLAEINRTDTVDIATFQKLGYQVTLRLAAPPRRKGNLGTFLSDRDSLPSSRQFLQWSFPGSLLGFVQRKVMDIPPRVPPATKKAALRS